MTNIDNVEFEMLASNILQDDKFLLLKNDRHHGTTKYDHCKRVGYLSYKLAKFFNCDYRKIIRPALLHDFFYGERTEKKENDYLKHPNTSAINAAYYYNASEDEQDIIKTHMFHFACVRKLLPTFKKEDRYKLKDVKPKSKEAWIVCFSDLLVSIKEFSEYRVGYGAAVVMLFALNFISINK